MPNEAEAIFLDAGVFIGALLKGDPRHAEARAIVEAARRGEITACTSGDVLGEVYAALTWSGAQPPHPPDVAANAVRLLIAAPSHVRILAGCRRSQNGTQIHAENVDFGAKNSQNRRQSAKSASKNSFSDRLLESNLATAVKMLDISAAHNLTARRVHDARHAATALTNGVKQVMTYDIKDWSCFQTDGIEIVGPKSVM